MISGRSDSTLNRDGVRMGTSEFYRVVEELDEVVDSLVVDTGQVGVNGRLFLFLVLKEEVKLDDDLKGRIVKKLRQELSPRHVPDEIYVVKDIPRTLNGKKVEVPVKRILSGIPVNEAVSEDALDNPASLSFFVNLAKSGC